MTRTQGSNSTEEIDLYVRWCRIHVSLMKPFYRIPSMETEFLSNLCPVFVDT